MNNLKIAEPLQSIPEDQMRMRRVHKLQQERAIELRRSTVQQRIALIRKLRDSVLARREEIYQAMAADFRKPEAEVDLGEIMVVVQEANDAIKHLKGWMKPQKVKATKALIGTQNKIRYEPKGVCLIIAPWNFPVNLLLGPLISCLAAGNTAMLKPSEKQAQRLWKEQEEDGVDHGLVRSTAYGGNHIVFEGEKQWRLLKDQLVQGWEQPGTEGHGKSANLAALTNKLKSKNNF